MKKRNLTKILSMTLAMGIFLGNVPAFAITTPNAYKIDPVDEVNIFDTFSDYSSQYNRWNQKYHPNGWYSGSEGRIGNEREDVTGNNRVKMGVGSSYANKSGSILYKMFGKTVTDGKLHASWDFKSDNTDVLQFVVFQFTTEKDSASAEDAYDPRQASNEKPLITFRNNNPWSSLILDTKDPGKIVVYKSTDVGHNDDMKDSSMYSSKTYANSEWIKTDVFWDLDNKTYTIYVDGTKVTDGQFNADGIKGLYPILEPGKDKNEETINDGTYSGTDDANQNAAFAYLDNFYAHEYSGASDSVSAAAEYNYFADDEYGVINVSFSEYMNKEIGDGDIIVKDAQGNTVETALIYTSRTDAALMVQPGLSGDIYEISFSNSLKGAISGAVPAKMNFSVAVKDSESRYYYLNEDFNDYDGTYPVNWTFNEKTSNFNGSAKFLTDGYTYKSYQEKANAVTNTLDNSTALNMKGSTTEPVESLNLWHWFPSSTPLTGEFTVEFDVYHENGGWNFGYVSKQDFDAVANVRSGDVSGRSYQVLTAIPAGSTDNKLCFSQNGYSFTAFNRVSDAVVSPNAWHRVKVDVDTEAGTFKVQVDDSDPITVTDPNRSKYQKGIAAIRLSRHQDSSGNTGNVAFDNIKVYKTGTYVMNEDFDTYPMTLNKYGSAYWSTDKVWFQTAGGWTDPGWGIEWKPNSHAQLYNGFDGQVRAYAVNETDPWRATITRADGCTSSGPFLAVSGYLWADKWDAGERVPYASRLQKYFDRPIKKGKSFVIEMDMQLRYSLQTIAISLLDESDMTPTKRGVKSSGGASIDIPYITGNIVASYVATQDLPAGRQEDANRGVFAPDTKTSLNNVSTWATEDRQFKYVSGKDPGTPYDSIPTETDKLYPVSIKVEPYYDENGAPKAKITFINGGNSGSIITSQDFMNKEMVGIGIDYMGLQKASYADIRSALYIDDLRVYELDDNGNKITNSQKEAVESIKAVAVDGTCTDLLGTTNAVIPENTMRLDVKFSAPVSDTVANERMLALMKEYDDKIDYLSNKDGAYEIKLSDDKKTCSYYFKPGYLTEGTKYHLLVSNMVEFADNPLSQLDKDYRIAFTAGAASEGGFGVDTFSLQKKIDANTNFGETKSPDIYKVINRYADIDGDFNLNIEGYNATSDAKDVFVVIGYYNANNLLLKSDCGVYEATAGGRFDFSNVMKPESVEGATICKIYTWEYPSLIPLVQNIELK